MSLNVVQELDAASVAAGFGDLPTLAPVAVEVLRLADDDRATLDDIAKVINNDPGLAAQLLKVANSPMYGMGGTIASLTRATSVLGLRTVKLLSLSFGVVASTSGDERDAVIWRRTLATSALGQTIAQRFDKQLVDETFIAALLANIGRLALMNYDTYADATAIGGGWLDSVDELQITGTTGDAVAAEIFRNWGLPAQMAEAVAHRSDPSAIDGIPGRIAGFLHVADAAGAFILATDDEAAASLERWHLAAQHLGLDGDAADELLAEGQEALQQTADLFNVQPAAQPVAELLARARQGLARLSLDAVAALSQEETRAENLASENERLAAEALSDPLTGLPNRRAFDNEVSSIVAAHDRGTLSGSLGIMVLDLDCFKAVNDTHGHGVGDEVLREVANRLQNRCRSNEFVARMGGEEFAVLLPTTDREEIMRAGDGYRKAIGSTPVETSIGRLDITTSIGVATSDKIPTETADELYERADRGLYDAKHGGRNCVRSAD